jgi:hypothetical protein
MTQKGLEFQRLSELERATRAKEDTDRTPVEQALSKSERERFNTRLFGFVAWVEKL